MLAVCNLKVAGFRATISNQASVQGDELVVTQRLADALQISAGEQVRYLNLEKGAK